ncbi:Tn7-like element transposition protein TnsE [Geopseudomonas aromaticivorans]
MFRQIQAGSKLLAVGDFSRKINPEDQWKLSAFFDRYDGRVRSTMALEMSCVLAVGRKFTGNEKNPYHSYGSRNEINFSAIADWQERSMDEYNFLSRNSPVKSEVARQRCLVFKSNGLTVWIPKFELARKLFFHAAFLARAAFEPNGLDMIFNVTHDGHSFHIHTPPKTGAPSQLVKLKGYRDLFSWLLLEPDVKRSFESIWHNLNQKQEFNNPRSSRWTFDFTPPESIAGVSAEVQGQFDKDRGEFLVWEIKSLHGLKLSHCGDVFFHHPALKFPVRGDGKGGFSMPAQPHDIEVDSEEEPRDSSKPTLIDLPDEGVTFVGDLSTRIAYNGERVSSRGRVVDDYSIPGGESQTVGVADPVHGGIVAPGEFQQLGGGDAQEKYSNRFKLLNEIIRQIATEPGISLLSLEVKPLPPVPRCRYHAIDENTPRCYLLARFQRKDGSERYLMEIDTTDIKKPMSTRVMGFRDGVDARNCIEKILWETVKGSLRWPGVMRQESDPLFSINHPKDGPLDEYKSRVADWKYRIRAALS